MRGWRRRVGAAAVAGIALSGAFAWRGVAQTDPPTSEPAPTTTDPLGGLFGTTTTATSAPTTEPTSTEPETTPPTDPVLGEGDAGLSVAGGGPGQVVPADALSVLNSIRRTAPNDDTQNVADEQALVAAGYDPDQAARLAYGRFPVAGPAHWTDDFLDARFTGTEFRYHLGEDLIAAYGTPLRSPADGTIDLYDNDVGGLAVLVRDADGTIYELAHMSELAPGIVRGATVHVGDLLGAVGSSGDATTPHCHFGVWLHGVSPTSPKPLVDQWVADAHGAVTARLHPAIASRTRAMLGTTLVSAVAAGATPGPATANALLYATTANPNGGALRLAEATAAEVADGIDWTDR